MSLSYTVYMCTHTITLTHTHTLYTTTGSWTQALKRVLESVYSYFSYDINTYVASRLETWSRSPTATEAAPTVNESPDTSRGGDSPAENRLGGRFFHSSTSSSEESTGARGSSSSKAASADSPSFDAAKKPPNKSISSFTVENILMGRQRSSSSSESPTTTSGNFSTPPPSSSSVSTISNHSSVVGTNWVSHPPVKYTKFTMLSPTSMADETQRKKRSEGVIELQWRDQGGREQAQLSTSSGDYGNGLKRTPSSLRGSMVDLPSAFSASQKPKSLSRSSSSGTPSSFFHKGSVSSETQQQTFPTQNIFQTAAKVSTLPIVQTVPAAAATTDMKSAVLHQTFPASGQQVVLLIPSNSTSIGGNLSTVFCANPVFSLGQSSISSSLGTSTVASKLVAASSPPTTHSTSMASQPSEERVSTLSSHQRHAVVDREVTPPPDQSESYRPIAPKTTAQTAESASRDHRGNDRMKLYLKRTMPKPPKLRFHMTTVMKQPAGNTVMTSLTAQSPQAITSETVTASVERGPLSVAAASENEQHLRSSEVAVESTITRSPNIYSNESSGPEKNLRTSSQWVKQEPQDSSSTCSSSPTSSHGSPKPNLLNSSTTLAASGSPSSGKNGSVSKAQTSVLKDSGFHLQLVKQQGRGGGASGGSSESNNQNSTKELESSPGDFQMMQKSGRLNGRQQSGPGRGRGRATRSYTRRKRELIFHLYEDPSTAFRAKRQCRDKEPQH